LGARLYTIGYENRDLDEFIDILIENGIDLLADIRAIPYSRRREFSKKALTSRLAITKIEYAHFGSLGSPKELRDKVRADNDYGYFFMEYDKYLRTQDAALAGLLELIREKKVCLMCYEMDADRCHRRAVAERIKQISRDAVDISNL
jgi:uncharacterized protein (DUF488 family)